ncbi:MAG: peptidoglycan-binding protein [Rhodobacteraceae bacterium]|nr:peptidoglycan-binding protein [Paracoccaceae bacterium]
MHFLKIVPLVVALMGLNITAAAAQNLALVLSNSNYEQGVNVPGIARQHQQIVRAFRDSGYEVIEGRDLNRLETRQQIERFAQRLDHADIAVVSLQGHMANFRGRSWFLPSDIAASSVTSVEFRGVSLDYLAVLLGQKRGKGLMFVGNSGRSVLSVRGVAAGVSGVSLPRGVMMVTGDYGELGATLQDRFLRINTRIGDVVNGYMGGLKISGDVPSRLVMHGRQGSNLPPAALTPEDIEKRLGLSRSDRRRIQQDLTIMGYNTRGIDGIFGAGTRSSIRDWQRSQRFERTGFITGEQLQALRRQAGIERENYEAQDRRFWAETGASGSERGLRRYLERYPEGLFANRARAELERFNGRADARAWAEAERVNTERSYRQYLRSFPNGRYREIALQRISSPPQNVENDAKRQENALRLNSLTRLLIEQRIADLGYRVGVRDGVFDLWSRQGFRAFQRDRRMPATGYVSADMIRRLLLNQ